MIDIQRQWCIQVDVTDACVRRCSNCTRLVGQVVEPFYMTVGEYEHAVRCLADFPSESLPAADPMFARLKSKVVGMIGGEPLLHPDFEELCLVAEGTIPRREQRGLWTGLRWERTSYAEVIRRVFGYVNNNLHEEAVHTPVLAAVADLVHDDDERRRLIDDCWLQRLWSGTVTPRGLFFCEVAAAMDKLYGGPGGIPVEPGCWRRPMEDFRGQVDMWCRRCGVSMNLRGRPDRDELDDVTPSNVPGLPRPERCVQVQLDERDPTPWRYLR